ncbi:hypothetical protein Dda_7862 [Drechslerella dactyloides]|uniref:Regulator of phospholipase D SRF1 n=1 Tax=Drechslerella dactyloides TaxID=74499 RepID=A0AAD6IR45_DREDA|nr:hypothetical protein Dda_7862 [Drechslerella dactyloides]
MYSGLCGIEMKLSGVKLAGWLTGLLAGWPAEGDDAAAVNALCCTRLKQVPLTLAKQAVDRVFCPPTMTPSPPNENIISPNLLLLLGGPPVSSSFPFKSLFVDFLPTIQGGKHPQGNDSERQQKSDRGGGRTQARENRGQAPANPHVSSPESMAQDVTQAQPPTSPTTASSGLPATSGLSITTAKPPALSACKAKRTSKGSAVSESTTRTSGTGSEKPRFSADSQLQWRAVRTVPTWVQRHEDEGEQADHSPMLPPPAHRTPQKSVWDNRRENVPVTPRSATAHEGSRWRNFAEQSSGRPFTAASERKDLEVGAVWGDEGLSTPWLANKGEGEGEDVEDGAGAIFGITARQRQIWYKRFHIVLLNNPMVPLTFRAIIWIVSLFALSFSASIYVLSARNHSKQLPSTVLAIVVDAVALVYIIYITYDEYSGKPLGLRSPKAKIRLIMFDLVFIIFDSANLSLAFDTLNDVQQSCSTATGLLDGSLANPICSRQRALASFLFLALCAWVSTFTVSVFRLVERVSRTNA